MGNFSKASQRASRTQREIECGPSFDLALLSGFYGVMVSTLDFESSDPSSNLGRTCSAVWRFRLNQLVDTQTSALERSATSSM